MDAGLLSMHKRLLAEKPDGAKHDAETCPLCALAAAEAVEPKEEGQPMSTATEPRVYSEDELQARVDAAVATAMEARDADAAAAAANDETASLREQVAELQSQLDAEVLARTALETEKVEADQAWADLATAAEEAERIEACKADRLAKVREVATFPEDYLEKNADRFAAMSDEDFEARLEEYRTIASKEDGDEPIPSKTVLTAAREGAGSDVQPGSMLSELSNLRSALTDPRTL